MSIQNQLNKERADRVWAELSKFTHKIIYDDVSKAIELCELLTREYDDSHDIEHHVKVVLNALTILRKMIEATPFNFEDCEAELVNLIFYICIFHDVVDHKYPDDIEMKTTEIDVHLKRCIPLQATDCWWIIRNMSFSKEKKFGYPTPPDGMVWYIGLARDICSDSDKLEAIGPIGLARCQAYTRATHSNATDREIKRLVYIHCVEKLVLLMANFIRTDEGKEMAIEGHNHILAFMAKYTTPEL